MKDITMPIINWLKSRFFAFLLLIITIIPGFSQNVGINATGVAPSDAAGLDVDFANKGVLIPRVALTGTASFAPLAAHVAGMIVYNTATVLDVTPGLYINNGTKWIPTRMTGNSAGNMLFWDGSAWAIIPAGTAGQYLQLNSFNIPGWTTSTGTGSYATLTTTAATAITATTTSTGGNITNDGGLSVLSRGVCYGTTPNPTTANSVSNASPATGTGVYTNNLTGLLAGTTYYIRAFATNNAVTSYGNEVSFTTTASMPTLAATTAASAITGSTANSGGNVIATGGAVITERGVVYSTATTPTILTGTKVIDSSPGAGSFTSNLTGLSGGTLYYVRAYATNSIGTSYGTQISFTTTVVPPTLVTVAATNISGGSAASGGSMNWNGGGYSNFGNYGVAYSTTPVTTLPVYIETSSPNYARVATNTTNGSVNPAVNIAPWVTNLIGLAANTTYYIRSYLNLWRSSTSSWITVYGPEISFTTTAPTAPVMGLTTAPSLITGSTVRTGGAITSDGGSPVTAKGVCWGTSPSPTLGAGNYTTDGTGTLSFVSNPTGLSGSTTYYIRAYATNAIGTSYSTTDQTFTTCVASAYNVGDIAGGGRVFYVNCDGSGLIATMGDQPTTAVWGCSGTSIVTSTALGSGAANTAAILAGCADRPIAASLASSCTDGGFNDWYLPSSTELGLLVNSGYLFPSGGVSYYCSSSQSSSTYVSGYYYANNWQASGLSKTTQFKVRAIRRFAPPSLPSVTTDPILNIAGSSATCGGNVTSDGGSSVSAGVCWSTTTTPTIADSHTTDANAAGTFVSNLSGLSSSTTYYVRAYATNGAGTAYGSEVSFTTSSPTAPVITTAPITNQTSTSGTSGGTIVSNGGSAVSVSGICWSTTTGPTTADSKTIDGTTSGSFSSDATGLTAGTTYNIRAYATNGIGTSYGNEINYTPVVAGLPVVTTDPIVNLVGALAEGGGTIVSDGGDAITDQGLCWSTSANPTIAANFVSDNYLTTWAWTTYFCNITGLTVGTTYHVRAYATNSAGTSYGNDITFVATAATIGQLVAYGNLYGMVYSIDGNGTHGLIADFGTINLSDWGCTSSVTGAVGTAIGTGSANTTAIIADINTNVCESSNGPLMFASQMIKDFLGSDWYLPSKDEFNLLWTNRVAAGLQDGFLYSSSQTYWSSSEVDATKAWYLDVTNPLVPVWNNTGLKDAKYSIWAIRSF